MPAYTQPESGSNQPRLDTLQKLAQQLVEGLNQLEQYQHSTQPKPNRRKGVDMAKDNNMVRAGSRTYFFDAKKTEKGDWYLLITESRYKGEGKDRERNSIAVYKDHAAAFLGKASEALAELP